MAGVILGGGFGCVHEHHHRDIEVAGPPAAVVVVPGYYYDREYNDDHGIFHLRLYYHYDGHRWDHVDVVPHGYEVRQRPMVPEAPERGGYRGDRH